MEHRKPSQFQRPSNLRRILHRLRRPREGTLTGKHKVERRVTKRNPITGAGLHQRLHRLPRDPDSIPYADLPQREDIPPSRRLHAQRICLRREVAAGDKLLKRRRVEMHGVEPVLAGVNLLPRQTAATGGRLDGEGAGAGDDVAERLRQGEEAEIGDVAGLAGDGDDVSETDGDDENAGDE